MLATSQQAAAGAMIAELLLAGRIRAGEDKRPKLEVVDPTPLGDPLLDDALQKMVDAGKPKKGMEWSFNFNGNALHGTTKVGKLHRRVGDIIADELIKEDE